MLAGPDFMEGVRALLVDKDRRPRWRHANLLAVSQPEVEACMAPLPEGELVLDWDGP
jgi:enoyl-CoA hydratase